MNVLCPKCGAPVDTNESSATCASCGTSFAVGEAKTSADLASPADPLVGKVVGGCRLTERVGSGGMGVVYKAEQVSLGRVVAVKLLPETLRQDPQIQERFQREIAILARLNHPNIVGILDGGLSEHGAYFVMEFVDGVSLRRILSTGGVKPLEALQIIPQLCDALEFAHGRGVVHRDIKPENILIDKAGRVRLLDFGLSRIAKTDVPGLLTRPTQVLGTFEYMAPEQREASRTVDHRADLYSLGVVLYEMLTGELPIGRFDPPSVRNLQIDVRLDEVVLHALEKSPDRRYQRASDIKTEVERISASPPPVVEPPIMGGAQAPPAQSQPSATFGARSDTKTPPATTNFVFGAGAGGGAGAGAGAGAGSGAWVPPGGSAPSRILHPLHPALIAIPFVVIGILGLSGSWIAMLVTAALLAYGLRQISPAADKRNQWIVWGSLAVMAIEACGAELELRNSSSHRYRWGPFPTFGWVQPWIAAAVLMAVYAWLPRRLASQFESRPHAILWAILGAIGMIGVGSGQFIPALVAGGLAIFVERLMREHGRAPNPNDPPPPPPQQQQQQPGSAYSAAAAPPAPPPPAYGGQSQVSKLALLSFGLAVAGCGLVAAAIATVVSVS